MAYRTYEEWKARGRHVVSGEKAAGFLNSGEAIFGKEQTKKTSARSNYELRSGEGESVFMVRKYNHGMDWDEAEELGLNIGLPGQW